MRCCAFYSPDNSDIERHDGLRMDSHYKLHKPLDYATCSNPDVSDNIFNGCGYGVQQDKCPFYTPEEPASLKHLKCTNDKGEEVELKLEAARITFGIVEFIVSETRDDVVLSNETFSAHKFGEQEAISKATEVFESKRSDYEKVEEVETPKPTDKSYILKVTQNA